MTSDEILEKVRATFKTDWQRRDGDKVPEPEDIKLDNDAMILDGTVLYADMIDSTGLVMNYKDWFAAEIYKAYLNAACYIIRNNSGAITAFDGDRVMAVYIGASKNSEAGKTALQINYIVREINTLIKEIYPSTSYQLRQSIGIDTSSLFVARTGIRKYNDLGWVGRSANYASKLCGLADQTYTAIVTEEVHSRLRDDTKYGGNPKVDMWEKYMWQEKGMAVYRTSWYWKF